EQDPSGPVLSLEQRMDSLKLMEVRHKVKLLIQSNQLPHHEKAGRSSKALDKMHGKRPPRLVSYNHEIHHNNIPTLLEPYYVVHHRSLLIVLESITRQIDSNLNQPTAYQCILELCDTFMRHWLAEKALLWLHPKASTVLFRMSRRMQVEFLTTLATLLWKASDELFVEQVVVAQPNIPSNKAKQRSLAKSTSPVALSLRSVAYSVLAMVFDAAAGTVSHVDVVLCAMMAAPSTDHPRREEVIATQGLALQKKVFGLIRANHLVEAHRLLDLLIRHVFPSYSVDMTERAQKWMEAVCSTQSALATHMPIVTSFVSSLLKSPTTWLRMANAIHRFLSPDNHENDEEGEEEKAENDDNRALACLTLQTVAPITTLLVQALEQGMADVDRELKGSHHIHHHPRGTSSSSLFIACNHEDNKRKATAAAAALSKQRKGRQDAKLIPDLIFQVEQYDVVIIKLSKLCKVRSVNFSRWCVRRQARDFKLNMDTVSRLLPGDHDDEEQDNDPPHNDTNNHRNQHQVRLQHASHMRESAETRQTAAMDDMEHGEVAEINDGQDDMDMPSSGDESDDVPATARQEEEEDDEMASRHLKRRRRVVEEED
ncbi:hypothetical protein DYB31_012450, partial [Aphanomyces astaci]